MHTGSFHSGSVNEGFVMDSRLSDIFTTETFFYSSFASKSLGQHFSRSAAPSTYRDDIFQNIENQRYAGCRQLIDELVGLLEEQNRADED